MPTTTVNGGSVAYQGKLYVATNCFDVPLCPFDGMGSVVWRYDPGTDQWDMFAQLERDWWDVSAGVIGGKLYLVEEFGGAMDILDLATGTWSTGPNRPFRACGAATTVFQARLYLFGWCDDYRLTPRSGIAGWCSIREATLGPKCRQRPSRQVPAARWRGCS